MNKLVTLFKLFLFVCIVSVSTPFINAQEMLVNGDFESWDDASTPSSWTHVESCEQESTTIHGGTYSVKHTGGTSDLGQGISGIVGGDSYTLSIWYKVVEDDGQDARIWSYWKNESGSISDNSDELRGPDGQYLDNNGGVWTEYTVTLEAPAEADSFYFEVRTYGSAVVYYDDFSFYHNSDTLFSDDFEDATIDKWQTFAVTGDTNWFASNYSGNNFAKATGYYNSTRYETELWLIADSIDMSTVESKHLNFNTAAYYSDGTELTVYYSTDYIDDNDPSTATWTALSGYDLSIGTYYSWVNSGDIDLSSITSTTFSLAFVYTSTSSAATTYELDNVVIAKTLVDTTAPVITWTPADEETGVDTATTITISFDEAIRNIDNSEITNDNVSSLIAFKATNKDGDDSTFTATINDDKTLITVTPTYGLEHDHDYWVNLLAVEDTNDNATESDTIVFTTVAETETISTIADLRNGNTDGTTYKLSSEPVISHIYVSSYGTTYYIQDETAGIVIWDYYSNTISTSYSVGDALSGLVGTLSDYNGLLEFIPEEDPGTAASTGNILTPKTISVSELKTNFEDYEAELIRVDTVRFSSVGSFNSGSSYKFYKGEDSAYVYTNFSDADYLTATIPDSANLIGIAIENSKGTFIAPRDSNDITFISEANPDTVEVSTIAALRSANEGSIYKLTGEAILTYQQSYKNKKYLQDATGGIEIVDDSGIITTEYTIGDGITGLCGTVSEASNGMVDLTPVKDPGSATSSDNDVTPVTITVAEFKSNIDSYESQLVRIDTVIFKDAGSTFETGASYDFISGSDTSIMYTSFYDADYFDAIIPDTASLIGIAFDYYGTAELTPRDQDDIITSGELETKSNNAYLSSISINDVAIADFDSATFEYTDTLATSVIVFPTVTYTLSDESASAEYTKATTLPGASKIVVTAEDGTTIKTYTINFVYEEEESSIAQNEVSTIKFYPTPVSDELTIENLDNTDRIQILNITGSVIYDEMTDGSSATTINTQSWNSGLYLIRSISGNTMSTYKLIKQ